MCTRIYLLAAIAIYYSLSSKRTKYHRHRNKCNIDHPHILHRMGIEIAYHRPKHLRVKFSICASNCLLFFSSYQYYLVLKRSEDKILLTN
ncbi:MAG: hypothetical protein ACW963_09440, partial [Candidatus Sifarchaeia archaeon]